MVERCRGNDGHLEKSEDHEFPEDSDYESECESAGNLGSGKAEADCEEKRGHELLPLLKIGSPTAYE